MVRKLKYQLIKMKNSEEININQIKRFSMPVLFTGAVNFFCGRLGIDASASRCVAQKKIMQKVWFYGKIFSIYLHSELYFVHFI